MEKAVLQLSVGAPASVTIEVFDVRGNLVKREALIASDPGSSANWIPVESWKFFSQF